MRTVVYLKCGHCNGAGRVVGQRPTEMLYVLHRHEWLTTEQSSAAIGVKATNGANILRDLFEMGLVERRGSGSRHSPYEWRRL